MEYIIFMINLHSTSSLVSKLKVDKIIKLSVDSLNELNQKKKQKQKPHQTTPISLTFLLGLNINYMKEKRKYENI
jgi:hypothetical protein